MSRELLAAEQSFAAIYRTVGALENYLHLAAALLVAKDLQHPEDLNQQQKERTCCCSLAPGHPRRPAACCREEGKEAACRRFKAAGAWPAPARVCGLCTQASRRCSTRCAPRGWLRAREA